MEEKVKEEPKVKETPEVKETLKVKVRILGQEVDIWYHVPYEKQVEAAEEFVSRAVVFDEELGICYWSFLRDPIEVYMKLATYTNADLSAYDGVDGLYKLMDDCRETAPEDQRKLVTSEWSDISLLADEIYDNTKLVFETRHSLKHRIASSFGFLLDGRDLTETLASAREVNEQMIDHLGAIAKVKSEDLKPVDITAYKKKQK